MKQSEISFKVELDNDNIPEKIFWAATDNPNEGIEDTMSIYVAVWDHYHKGTMAIPLWTKDMEVTDMKRFYIEIMGTISETIANATGDNKMASQIDDLCRKLTGDLKEEIKNLSQQS